MFHIDEISRQRRVKPQYCKIMSILIAGTALGCTYCNVCENALDFFVYRVTLDNPEHGTEQTVEL